MRPDVSTLARCWLRTFDTGRHVLEVGSYQTPGQNPDLALSALLPDDIHLGGDLRPGPGVRILLEPHGPITDSDVAHADVVGTSVARIARRQCGDDGKRQRGYKENPFFDIDPGSGPAGTTTPAGPKTRPRT